MSGYKDRLQLPAASASAEGQNCTTPVPRVQADYGRCLDSFSSFGTRPRSATPPHTRMATRRLSKQQQRASSSRFNGVRSPQRPQALSRTKHKSRKEPEC